MEVVLGVFNIISEEEFNFGLNPCFSGSCSWRADLKNADLSGADVLILVLVEVVLGEG